MSKGYVYILTNPSMPGVVKIGKTTRSAEARAAELFQTGVPTPFIVAYSVFTPDCHDLEATIHHCLPDRRVSKDREFFAFDLKDAIELLDDLHHGQVEEWLAEFMPDQCIVNADMALDGGLVAWASHELDLYIPEVVSVINQLTPDDLIPGLERHRARIEKNKAARAASEAGNVTH